MRLNSSVTRFGVAAANELTLNLLSAPLLPSFNARAMLRDLMFPCTSECKLALAIRLGREGITKKEKTG